MTMFKTLVFNQLGSRWEVLGDVRMSVPANVGYLVITDHHYVNTNYCSHVADDDEHKYHHDDCTFYSCRDGKLIRFQNNGEVHINVEEAEECIA